MTCQLTHPAHAHVTFVHPEVSAGERDRQFLVATPIALAARWAASRALA